MSIEHIMQSPAKAVDKVDAVAFLAPVNSISVGWEVQDMRVDARAIFSDAYDISLASDSHWQRGGGAGRKRPDCVYYEVRLEEPLPLAHVDAAVGRLVDLWTELIGSVEAIMLDTSLLPQVGSGAAGSAA
jgi:hypothetical protein